MRRSLEYACSEGTLGFLLEKVLPLAIKSFVPAGLMGLLLAGLFAAFMGTFASTVNAAPAYLINDVYLRYINPQAKGRRLIYASYLICALVVIVSTVIGFFVPSINSILQWIVSALRVIIVGSVFILAWMADDLGANRIEFDIFPALEKIASGVDDNILESTLEEMSGIFVFDTIK